MQTGIMTILSTALNMLVSRYRVFKDKNKASRFAKDYIIQSLES